MMDYLSVALMAVCGYLIGAVSMARIVARIVSPQTKITDGLELELEGSDKKLILGTVSASWVSHHLGAKYGFLTYVLDVLKILIPGLIIKYIWPSQPYFLIAAVAAVVGHIWPLYYRFKGGRGISVIYGGLFLIDWIGVFVCSITGMIFGLFLLRDVSAAYVAGVILIIPWVYFRTHNLVYVLYAVIVNIFFIIAMIPELRNYARIKKEEKWDDPAEVIQLSGMGRGILKMGRKLGVFRKKENDRAKGSRD